MVHRIKRLTPRSAYWDSPSIDAQLLREPALRVVFFERRKHVSGAWQWFEVAR